MSEDSVKKDDVAPMRVCFDDGAGFAVPGAKYLDRLASGAMTFFLGRDLEGAGASARTAYAEVTFGEQSFYGLARVSVDRDWAESWYLRLLARDSVLDRLLTASHEVSAPDVASYPWKTGQPGVAVIAGASPGMSLAARFLGWIGGDAAFAVVELAEVRGRLVSALGDGLVGFGFAGHTLPPSRAELVGAMVGLADGAYRMIEDGEVLLVRSGLRPGGRLDEVLRR